MGTLSVVQTTCCCKPRPPGAPVDQSKPSKKPAWIGNLPGPVRTSASSALKYSSLRGAVQGQFTSL
eukprot:4873072-Pyramimonas_sp.AAC.1